MVRQQVRLCVLRVRFSIFCIFEFQRCTYCRIPGMYSTWYVYRIATFRDQGKKGAASGRRPTRAERVQQRYN